LVEPGLALTILDNGCTKDRLKSNAPKGSPMACHGAVCERLVVVVAAILPGLLLQKTLATSPASSMTLLI
jgi:hypothetical protein